jgi:hypothetical protein
MKFSIHTELLWFAGFLYLALVGGICAVLTFLVLTERAGATRHSRATCEAQAAQKKDIAERARARERGE